MTDHPNVQRVRAIYDGLAAGDLTAFGTHVAPDVRWHFNGRSWLAGTHEGIEAVLGVFARLAEASGGTFAPIPRDIVGNDRHVVSIVDASATIDGEEVTSTVALVWTFDGDRIVDVREHIFDVYAVDEALGA